MNDPMTRIADALELRALAAYDVLEPTDRSADGDALRKRIEARHSASAVVVPVLPTTDAGNALVDALLTRGLPPPDDDPEWRDVPAERAYLRSVRHGDRYWNSDVGPWITWGGPDSDNVTCVDARWIKRHDHPARKPAPVASEPQTAYVSGSRLRIGDVLIDGRRVVSIDAERWPVVESGTRLTPERVYFVRVPRPAAEPVAKAKCATCRCMIAPGTMCACCESTSGDDPPLPGVDADVEPSADEDIKRRDPGCECVQEEGDSDCPVHPSDPETGEPIGDWHRSIASGEGIARLRHTLLEIGAHSWAVGELHDQPWLMASRIVSAINAAHAHATRELRERCEWAERDRDELQAAKDRLVKACECVSCRGSILPPMQCGACIERAAPCPPGMPARPITTALLERLATAERDRDEVRASLLSGATLRDEYQRERDEARAEFNIVADERDRAKLERIAAIARAEAAERVVDAVRRWIHEGPYVSTVIRDAIDAYDAARKDGAR